MTLSTRRGEPINDLRVALGLHDLQRVSVVMLKGLMEIEDPALTYRTFAESGDQALVIVGPSDSWSATFVTAEDGARIYTITVSA